MSIGNDAPPLQHEDPLFRTPEHLVQEGPPEPNTPAPLNVEYGPVHESEVEDEEEDGLLMGRFLERNGFSFTKDTWCVISVAALLLVAVFIAIAGVTIGPEPTFVDEEGVVSSDINGCTTTSPTGDNALGTCWDPILNLKPQSSIQGKAHGVVAADHALCSQMGATILRDKGGNAIDAAVTTALCLGVANPASSGMGGGAFMLIHSDPVDEDNIRDRLPPHVDARDSNNDAKGQAASGKRTEVIDCREVAPKKSDRDMFLNVNDPDASTFGGLAVAVPAELKGLELAHALHGTLSWKEVVTPVAKLARDGVEVNAKLAEEIKWLSSWFRKQSPSFVNPLRKVLTHNDNWRKPLKAGDVMLNPALADTLDAVAEEGSAALFSGDRAEAMAREIQNAGGIIETQEMEDYQPTIRSPVISCEIGGFCLAGVPPPSSGGSVVVFILRFLTGFFTPVSAFANTLSKHWFVEACRHGFSIRMSLSDPSFNSETVRNAVKDLVDSDYVNQLRSNTSDEETLSSLSGYGGEQWAQISDEDGAGEAKQGDEGDRRRRMFREFGYLEDQGTSHFSVVDAERNAVAMTTTVNTVFGSCVLSKATGVLFNSQMDDFGTPGRPNAFGLAPAESNFIFPGKKPLSSMSPTLVFRAKVDRVSGESRLGDLVSAVGASGGPKIITATAQAILNNVILGMPLFESVTHPRIHDQLIYNEAAVTGTENVTLETKEKVVVSKETREALLRRKHSLLDLNYMGSVQAVAVDLETNILDAACDIRKGGEPDGY